jgi:calpain-15
MTFQIFDPTEISICLYQPSNRGRNDQNHKEVDLCLLVVRYEGEGDSLEQSNSLSLPVECVLHSKSQITSQINCSSLLNPGRYAVMPLSFRNLYKNGQGLLDTAASHDGHVIPYVLALFAAKVVEWQEQVSTKPGFLAESLFLLARKIGKKDRVK